MEWVLVPLAFFGLVAFLISTVATSWQRQRQAKLLAEFNARMLERAGSFKDFGDFLQTSGGAAFMNSLTQERGTSGPRVGLLRSVQIGVVLVVLGIGLLALASHFSRGTGLGAWNSSVNSEVFMVNGVIALSLGAGFLLASTVSYGVARKLGLLQTADGHKARPIA